MPDLFTCLDYEGVPVSCDAEVWQNHVLREHPELGGHEAAAQQALSEPLAVYKDRDHPDRKLFYRTLSLFPSARERRLKAVVEYHQDEDGLLRGRVVTAYPSRNIRRGDTLLWASPTITT